MNFNRSLQELRKKNNLSQEELAEKINVARQTISKWELGETAPNLEQAIILANTLNVDLNELVLGKAKKVSTTNKYNFLKIIGLIFTDILAILLFVMILLLFILIVSFSIITLFLALNYIFKLENLVSFPYWLKIPRIPYLSGLVLAISLLGLSTIGGIGCIYFYKALKQMIFKYRNFHHVVTTCKELNIKIDSKLKNTKNLNFILKIATIIFIIFFILFYITAIINTNSLDFWSSWNWFK